DFARAGHAHHPGVFGHPACGAVDGADMVHHLLLVGVELVVIPVAGHGIGHQAGEPTTVFPSSLFGVTGQRRDGPAALRPHRRPGKPQGMVDDVVHGADEFLGAGYHTVGFGGQAAIDLAHAVDHGTCEQLGVSVDALCDVLCGAGGSLFDLGDGGGFDGRAARCCVAPDGGEAGFDFNVGVVEDHVVVIAFALIATGAVKVLDATD